MSQPGLAHAERQLAGVFDNNDIEEARRVLQECMRSVIRVRSTIRCPKTGGIQYEDVPNHSLRLAASVKVLEYAIGKPTQRIITETSNTPKSQLPDLIAMIKRHPQVAGAVVRSLTEAASKVLPIEEPKTVVRADKQDVASSSAPRSEA